MTICEIAKDWKPGDSFTNTDRYLSGDEPLSFSKSVGPLRTRGDHWIVISLEELTRNDWEWTKEKNTPNRA